MREPENSEKIISYERMEFIAGPDMVLVKIIDGISSKPSFVCEKWQIDSKRYLKDSISNARCIWWGQSYLDLKICHTTFYVILVHEESSVY